MAKSDLVIRNATEADLPHVARIHVASWRDAYRGVIPDVAIDARTVEGATEMWSANLARYPANLTVAAMPDGQITGFSCAGPVTDTGSRSGPYEFEVYALHVRPDIRRNGIGAALLRHAMTRAGGLHMRSLIVWTLEDLHLSRRFYEREGGTLVKHGAWQVGGVKLPELAYGWDW